MNKKIDFEINTDLNSINQRLSKQLEQVEKSLKNIHNSTFDNSNNINETSVSKIKSKTRKSRFSKHKITRSIFRKKKLERSKKTVIFTRECKKEDGTSARFYSKPEFLRV